MKGKKYNYRFSYDPLLDAHGNPIVVTADDFSDTDLKRFLAHASAEYLTADYIAALSGLKSGKHVTHTYNVYKREPNRWIDIAEPQWENRGRHFLDNLAYSLSDKTKRLLKNKTYEWHSWGANGPFEHKLNATGMRASFEIAVIEGTPIEIIPYHVIQTSENTPEKTRAKLNVAHKIVLDKNAVVIPDVYPFAIKTDGYSLIFIEADRDTEDLEAALTKLEQYAYILENRIHTEQYGFTRAFVIFGSISRRRLDHIKLKVSDRIPKAKTRERILFTIHPDLHAPNTEAKATGHLVTEDYERAGLPNFNFLGAIGGGNGKS